MITLFLQMLRQLFFGEPHSALDTTFADLSRSELFILTGLLALVVLIGVWPAWLIALIAPAAGG